MDPVSAGECVCVNTRLRDDLIKDKSITWKQLGSIFGSPRDRVGFNTLQLASQGGGCTGLTNDLVGPILIGCQEEYEMK